MIIKIDPALVPPPSPPTPEQRLLDVARLADLSDPVEKLRAFLEFNPDVAELLD